jgi:nitrogen fixation NifU-like protein
MAIEYTDKVIEHFKNPRNLGELKDANVVYTTGSPACGDQVTLYLKVNKKTKIIDKIKFKSYGCASNIATASIITEMAKGKSLEFAKKLSWKQCCDELGGLPPAKVHCSILAIDTLKGAIREYEKKFEGLKFDETLNDDLVKETLKSVSNPTIGQDIVSLKQVTYIKVDDKNNVSVEIMAKGTPKDAMDTIVTEIKEHLHELKGIKKITVKIVTE